MIVQYEGQEFVVDKEADFYMLRTCYQMGCNCYNCYDRILDHCIVDEIFGIT